MSEPRKPGEIRPGDRVIILDRSRDLGHVVSVDGDTAQVVFAGCGDKLWPTPLVKLARHWDVKREWTGRGCWVSARHPLEGYLHRGVIRSTGVDGYSMAWSVETYEHEWSTFVGDYIAAERSLLAATDELDEDAPVEEVAAAVLARSGRDHAHSLIHNT